MAVPGPKTILTLQTKTVTSDSAGGYSETWADVEDISGVLTRSIGHRFRVMGENVVTGKKAVYSTHTFFCNEPSSITEKDRFTYGSRTFEIVLIYEPGNMNHHLEIDLLEIV